MVPIYQNRSSLLQAVCTDKLDFFPLHLHNSLELLYVTEGTLTIHYMEDEYLIRKGELAVIFPCKIHGCISKIPDSRTSCIMINCQPSLTDLFNSILHTFVPASPVLQNASDIKNVSDFMFELVQLGTENRNSDNSYLSSYNLTLTKCLIQTLLARLLPHIELVSIDAFSQPTLLSQILIYITEHFRYELSLSEIAAALHVSPGYISRLFTEQIHMNFVDYIHQIRIECAKELLLTTNMSVLDIALESGFGNLRSFNRVFKKLLGCTPQNYRKENQSTRAAFMTLF